MRIEKYTCDRCHRSVKERYTLNEICLYHKFSDKKCPGSGRYLTEEQELERKQCNFKDICNECILEALEKGKNIF